MAKNCKKPEIIEFIVKLTRKIREKIEFTMQK